ncbi:MAG: porin PorA family protein [Acidimicrobiales bacterium]
MRRFGTLLSVLGVLALLAGLIVNFFIVPQAKQLPADTDNMIGYTGTLSLALNPAALAENDLANLFLRDVPVTVDRHVRVLDTDGGKALVRSTAVVLDPAGNPVNGSDNWYTVDRKTMESIDNFTNDPNPVPREGLVTGFPIGTESRDYVGWNGEAEVTTTLKYEGELEREGVTVYHFTASNPAAKIVSPDPATLPPALPKATLAGLVGALGLPEETAGQLAGALELAPDPVPISYTFASNNNYYVDPATGILVDYDTNEVRVAGVEIAGNFQPLTEVWNLTFEQNAASIEEAKSDADDAQGQLFWLGTVLPWGLMIGGVLLALLGLWTRMKGDDAQDLAASGQRAGETLEDFKDRV